MKKLVLTLLVICLTLGTLGACKNGDTRKPPSDVIITIDKILKDISHALHKDNPNEIRRNGAERKKQVLQELSLQ